MSSDWHELVSSSAPNGNPSRSSASIQKLEKLLDRHRFEESHEQNWEVSDIEEPLVNVFTMGWMEDSRLGYPPDTPTFMQSSPRPVAAIRSLAKLPEKYATCDISAGSRHSLIQLVGCCRTDSTAGKYEFSKEETSVSLASAPTFTNHLPLSTKLMLAGLNQIGLCEEPGVPYPEVVPWTCEEEPSKILAANGNCFVITKFGNLYTWGHGRFGVLGHEDEETNQVPRLVKGLIREKIFLVAAGSHHVVVATLYGKAYSWGQNHKGQLGLGFESPMHLTPTQITIQAHESFVDIACGQNHTIALIKALSFEGKKPLFFVFAWGDESRGQLASGDAIYRSKPQENRWLTKFLAKNSLTVTKVAAGGNHNLAIVKSNTFGSGQVVSWGAGGYGQLGSGFLWDDPKPVLINGLDNVIQISAGLRHSMALTSHCGVNELFAWGYNGYGELGLGDCDMRIMPTAVSALSAAHVLQVECGDRHTIVRTSHKPVLAIQDPALKPYYLLLEKHKPTKALINHLKATMSRKGYDPALLDTPYAPLPKQAGATDSILLNERFEKGLRYCLDTSPDPPDWRRNAYETCFECPTPAGKLMSVCLACARECRSNFQLVPTIRRRTKGNNKCDCRKYPGCICRWSPIRAAFDFIASQLDGCVGPNQVKDLLQTLRAPTPIARDELTEALTALADGTEADLETRIQPVIFEEWYRDYYDEPLLDENGRRMDEFDSLQDGEEKSSDSSGSSDSEKED